MIEVVKLQVYVSTLKVFTGPVGLAQKALAPFGSVIVQVTEPLGTTALTTPVTVVVRIVIPPKVGLGEEAKEMEGNCWAMVNVIGVLVMLE